MAWTTATQTSIGVRWNATTDNIGVTGYRLYRNGTRVGTTTGTSYSVTGLACGTSYTIGLTARRRCGQRVQPRRGERHHQHRRLLRERHTGADRAGEPHGQRRHCHVDPAQLGCVDR